MDEIYKKINDIEVKIDAVYTSVEKTRKYFLTTLIATIVMFVLPLLALLIAIPKYLRLLNDITTF